MRELKTKLKRGESRLSHLRNKYASSIFDVLSLLIEKPALFVLLRTADAPWMGDICSWSEIVYNSYTRRKLPGFECVYITLSRHCIKGKPLYVSFPLR